MRQQRDFQSFAPNDFSGPDAGRGHPYQAVAKARHIAWADEDYGADLIGIGLFALHLLIVAYVLLGWQAENRVGLLAYLLLLPLIGMQWLFNGGSSIVNNGESLLRSGRWHDPSNAWEGAFFRTLLDKTLHLKASNLQVNLVVGFTMTMLWMTAFFHLIMIPA